MCVVALLLCVVVGPFGGGGVAGGRGSDLFVLVWRKGQRFDLELIWLGFTLVIDSILQAQWSTVQ